MNGRIVRTFFIGLLLLCVGGWVGSAFYEAAFNCWHGGRLLGMLGVSTFSGVVEVVEVDAWGTPYAKGFARNGWNWLCERSEHVEFWPKNESYHHYFLGFGYFALHGTERTVKGIDIPYWFLILISAALLWLVWRKTRPKPKGGAFPVELTKSKEAA